VLWNPVTRGRPYVRELQAIAASAARATPLVEGALESAGSIMTAQTLESVRAIDLIAEPPRAGHILVAGRDDMAPDTSLADHLAALGRGGRVPAPPGLGRHDGRAPVHGRARRGAAIDRRMGQVARELLALDAKGALRRDGRALRGVATASGAATIEERMVRFGADHRLFGVLTRTSTSADRPVVVIFNAGAVHRVGPNRVSVTLARELAAAGLAVLRFDLEGIGDSVRRTPGRENHPYPR